MVRAKLLLTILITIFFSIIFIPTVKPASALFDRSMTDLKVLEHGRKVFKNGVYYVKKNRCGESAVK